jgi:hypothetical protein
MVSCTLLLDQKVDMRQRIVESGAKTNVQSVLFYR